MRVFKLSSRSLLRKSDNRISNNHLIRIFCPVFHRYLITFLGKLSENSEVNKMSASNIAIVIAPNIIWSPEDEG